MLHPVDRLAVQRFPNGNARHRGRLHGAVPMLFVRRKLNDIAVAQPRLLPETGR